MNEINIKIKQVIDFIFRTIANIFGGIVKYLKLVKPVERIKKNPVIVKTLLSLLVSAGFIGLTEGEIEAVYQWVLVAVIILGGSVSARNVVKPLTKNQKKEQKENRKRKRKEVIQKAKRKVKRKNQVKMSIRDGHLYAQRNGGVE